MNPITRRRFGVIAASSPIWVKPIVTGVAVARDNTNLGSRPPPPATFVHPPPDQHAIAAAPAPARDAGQLPFTGDDIVIPTVAATAAIAAGAELLRRNRLDRESDLDAG